MQTVRHSFYTYHWGYRADLPAALQQSTHADDPLAAQLVRGSVAGYYNREDSVSGNHVGFYLAVDPAASQTYGGLGTRWSLLRVELPEGLRIANTAFANGGAIVDEDIRSRSAALGCPYFSLTTLLLMHPPTEDCARLAERIVHDLRIDAILYTYTFEDFGDPACQDPSHLSGALLLTRGDWLKPELVRHFTADTEDAEDERRVIEGLLLKAKGSSAWNEPEGAVNAATHEWRATHLLQCGAGFLE